MKLRPNVKEHPCLTTLAVLSEFETGRPITRERAINDFLKEQIAALSQPEQAAIERVLGALMQINGIGISSALRLLLVAPPENRAKLEDLDEAMRREGM